MEVATLPEIASKTAADLPAASLGNGWAGDLAYSGGAVWVAWASAADPEEELLAPAHWGRPVRREESLREGVTANDWRGLAPGDVTVSLGRLEGGSVADVRVLSRSGHAVEGPAIAPATGSGAPVVVWAEWDADGSTLVADADGAREVIARSRGAILGPRATGTRDGRTWVAWQQWPEGSEGVEAPDVRVAARGADGTWSAPRTVSAAGESAWAPALAAGPDGVVWCAWDAWDPLAGRDGGAYRVRVRAAGRDGVWGATADVSPPDANHYHLAPDVAAAEGCAWVVWNGSARWGYLNHRFNHMRTLHAAVVTRREDGLVVEAAPGEPPLGLEPGQLPVTSVPFLHMLEEEFITPQAPRVRLSPRTGRPVVFFRRFRSATLKDFGWTMEAMGHTGAGWTPPERVALGAGFPDAPYGVAPVTDGEAEGTGEGEEWVVAYHAGEYPEPEERNPSCAVRGHRLSLERVRLEAVPREAAPGEATAGPRGTWPAEAARREVPEGLREVKAGGQRLALLYGDLHRHSAYSKCMSANDGDPLDHWRWVQDVAELDFYALTEHLEYMSSLEWRRIQDLAQRVAGGGRVLALCGFELVLPPGHTNFFYADDAVGHDLRVACLTSASLSEVWPKLDAWIPEGKVVAIRHSQGHKGAGVAESYAPRWEPVAEIVQTRGDYAAWVQGLWKQGMRLGVVGASDHSRGAPFVQCLTGLWAPPEERTREGVLAGLRARRTFATNGPRMSVFLSAAGEGGGAELAMGDAGAVAGAPRLRVEASGTRPLETVELFRDEEQIARWVVGEQRTTVEHVDGGAPGGEHAYWVRVTQGQEGVGRRPVRGVAYSSPVWVSSSGSPAP